MNKEQPIKGWVKASEKLPDDRKDYNGRLKGKPAIVHDWKLTKGYITANGNLERVEDVEWLDETQTPIQSGEERWISVEDRLPDSGYLVMAFNGFSHQMYLGSYLKHSATWIFHGQERGNITHWMPLPKPPSLLSSEQNVQGSVASKADQGTEAGKQKK